MPFQVQVPGKGGFRGRRTKWISAMFANVESADKAQWLVDHWNEDGQWIKDNINPAYNGFIVHYRIVKVPATRPLTPTQIGNNIRLFLQNNPEV